MKTTRVEFGYASIKDVTLPEGGGLTDEAESFWGAETLKYLYLTFTSEDVGSLDEWVFSTEAHPFRIMR
ncbi:glycoside hydrolase [Tuber brumale]|nr:glycoside hydrolase [Tuber brumale]